MTLPRLPVSSTLPEPGTTPASTSRISAPHLSPGQAVDHAYLLRPGQPLWVIAADTQIVLQVISCDANRLTPFDTMAIAAFRHSAPSFRSRTRTPASRV